MKNDNTKFRNKLAVFICRILKQGFFVSLLFWWGFAWAEAGGSHLRVLSSSEQGCVVDFSPILFQRDTLILNGKSYQRISFETASPFGEEGDPMIPCGVLVVGIPPQGGVNVSVEASDFIEERDVRLMPIPVLKKKDGLPWEVYEEGEAYQKAGFLPGVLYEIEEPALFGDQRIVRILVYPVQYDPVESFIRRYTRIVLRVSFEGRGDEVLDWEKAENEDIYQKTLINYPDARKWRMRPVKKLRKLKRMFVLGEWYKIPVSMEKEGVFKVSGSFLKSHGIDIGFIEPRTLKIYNNGGRELPRSISVARPDSLIENPILLVGMEDNRFDESDYFLFYGKGVRNWEYNSIQKEYNHYNNIYTFQNIYWLVFNDGEQGRRIQTDSSLLNEGARTLSTFRDRLFLEQDINNTLNAGIHWYGQEFRNLYEKSYTVTFTDPIPEDTIWFRFKFKTNGNRFNVQFNEKSLVITQQKAFLPGGGQSGQNVLSFQYTGSKDYLDWFEVEYSRALKASGGELRFFSPLEVGKYEYHLSGFSTEPIVLDVTDIAHIRRMKLGSIPNGWAFVDSIPVEGPRRYVAVEASGYLSPEGIQEDEISDLRNPTNGADLIIITHRDFYDHALRLKALREEHDSLSVFVADVQDVYDEFNWGLFDPTAIRDFVRFAYKNWVVRPTYLLLFGDGDYDYRNIRSDVDKNWVPPFEYGETGESGSRTSDDWFTYVLGVDFQMDLAVGRIPVQTESEARVVVDKIIKYETEPLLGEWRSLVTMVGDDEIAEKVKEEDHFHIGALENMSNNSIPPLFNFKKIYLFEYPEVVTVEGRRKPQARDDLVEQINRGTLLVNYVGHGNEEVWAHEWIFQQDGDLTRLQNGERLPLFYAATCAFAHYDNPEKQSFSEDLLNSEGKGAIAVIAASRFCSALSNEALNKAFMDSLFSDQGPTLRLGDALRRAKSSVYSYSNNEMYHLLGDPTMRLCVPRYRAVFTKMEPDTFKALSVVKIEGQVRKNGIEWPDFKGKLTLKGFDSKRAVAYTTRQLGRKRSYFLPGNSLFRGEAQVDEGRFQISFVVPKDISYGGHKGRLSCYFWNDETDGGGYRNDIEVGGSAELIDTQGPMIEIFFTGQENFVTGEMVPEDPELVAVIQDDKSGINITGEIGHRIMLTVDGKQREDVTGYFQYDEGSYLKGKLLYKLTGLVGEHELALKAWDNANNSSIQSIVFKVVPSGDFRIEEVLNYPNPFHSSTHFTFQLNLDAEVEIKVFTTAGRLIRRIGEIWGGTGFNMVPWDGRDEMGDELANGVYLYRVIAKTCIDGRDVMKSIIGRLMIMR